MKREKAKMHPRYLLVLLSSAISFLFFFLPADSPAISCVESLKGLKGVEVLVEELKPELEDFNLTMIQIQSDVEMKLRNAGIPVLLKEENERIQALRRPYLYIRIHSTKIPGKRVLLAFSIEMALKQQVVLRGNSELCAKSFYAPTWYKSFVGAVGGRNVPELREIIKEFMEKFIRDYSAMNPRN